MQREIKVLNFSDIHLNHKRITDEIIDNVISMIQERVSEIDVVTFSGDLLYKPVIFGSPASEKVIDFLKRLDSLNLPIVMIGGTRSHEGQVIEFSGNLNLFKNITFVDKATAVSLNLPKHDITFDILCLPEEYIKSKHEYYNELLYLGKTYDLTILHGNIETFAFTQNDTENDNPKMINWSPSELLNVSPVTLAGHYHTSAGQDYDDNKYIGYTGSVTAFDFSDLTEKKMDLVTLKYNNDVYEGCDIEYIINHKSPKMKVIEIGVDNFKDLFIEDLFTNPNIKFKIKTNELEEATIRVFKQTDGVNATVEWIKDFNSYQQANIEQIERIGEMDIPDQINDFNGADKSLPREFIESFTSSNFNYTVGGNHNV